MDAAAFSFFGVIFGASLQYFFSRHLDNQKHRRELRTKAYTDYLNCVSEQASFGNTLPKEDRAKLFAKIADAKCRICLYGSSSAVNAFALFERLGASMKTTEQRTAFTNMVAIMRRDSGSNSEVSLKDLEAVLLGVHN